jgi:hypothetical protein
MTKREIILDGESARILTTLAKGFNGDMQEALRSILRLHVATESDADVIEKRHAAELSRQKHLSERDFREGKTVSWTALKRECGL